MSKMLQNCHLAELFLGGFFKIPFYDQVFLNFPFNGNVDKSFLPCEGNFVRSSECMINNRAMASAQHTVFLRITAVPRLIA